MRLTLVVLALVSGCATTGGGAIASSSLANNRGYRYLPAEHVGSSECLLDRYVPRSMSGPPNESASRLELYVAGRRVPGDDLVLATSADERAHDLALRSRHDERTGIAALVSGGVLLGPAAGFFGFGDDHDQKAALGTGAALLAVSGGTLLAGAILIAHSQDERVRAVLAYNQDAPPGCR